MGELNKLAIKFKTDKYDIHKYTPIYERFMLSKRNDDIKLLEIGVGGESNPNKGGNSLYMWKEYFEKGKIYAIDIFDKSSLQTNRIKIFRGSQDDNNFLKKVFDEIGGVDFIIDDGSHFNKHVIKTFLFAFKFLKPGGYYFIEDIQTSYWPAFGGDSFYLRKTGTSMNFFKSLTDSINYAEFDNPFFRPGYFEKNITEIHFYHNLIVVKKSENKEKSNVIKRENDKANSFRGRLKLIKYTLFFIKSKIYYLFDKMKF